MTALLAALALQQSFNPVEAEYRYSNRGIEATWRGNEYVLETAGDPPVPNSLKTEVENSGYVFKAEKHDLAIYKDGTEVKRYVLGYSRFDTIQPYTDKVVFGMLSFGKEVYVFACLRTLNHSGVPVGGGEIVRIYAPNPDKIGKGGAPPNLGRGQPTAAFLGASNDSIYFLCGNESGSVLEVRRTDLSTTVGERLRYYGIDKEGRMWAMREVDGQMDAKQYVVGRGLVQIRRLPFNPRQTTIASRVGGDLYFMQRELLYRPSRNAFMQLGLDLGNSHDVWWAAPYLFCTSQEALEIIDTNRMKSLGTRLLKKSG